ncbi:MAG: hypothetical protein EOM88_00010 [Clostridia bacterium]|nr:hypothetical protein [Clostridia bacterium]
MLNQFEYLSFILYLVGMGSFLIIKTSSHSQRNASAFLIAYLLLALIIALMANSFVYFVYLSLITPSYLILMFRSHLRYLNRAYHLTNIISLTLVLYLGKTPLSSGIIIALIVCFFWFYQQYADQIFQDIKE